MGSVTLHQKAVDVSAIIDNARLSSFQIFIFFACGIIAILDGFDNQAIAFVAPSIASEWGLKTSSFGPAFSAGLLGLTLGAIFLSPLADKVGRRTIILLSVAAFGILTFCTAFATSVPQLVVLRVLTGIGLGAALPNLIAITAEYAPARTRSLCIILMYCGVPLGGVLGGIISSYLISAYSWHYVFYFGGLLPLLMLPMFWMIPESIRFLVVKADDKKSIGAILRRIDPRQSFSDSATFILPEEQPVRSSVATLFSDGRAVGTVMLWLAFFCSLLVMYFLINWLPSILREAGHPLDQAIMATVLFNLGGVVGGILIGRLLDKMSPYKTVIFAFAGGAICTALLGFFGSDISVLLALIFLAGAGLMGGQLGVNALSAGFYPTHARATGIGWAMGIGRLGSILGPLMGGFLLSLNWEVKELYLVAAIPALAAALALIIVSRRSTPAVNGNKVSLRTDAASEPLSELR